MAEKGQGKLESLTGTTLADKYRLVAPLGAGGMGFVYQAEQLGLGRSVAIKILHKECFASGFDWFRTEAMAASRINHPHAVAVYDFGLTEEGLPFLVMEHLRGDTLAQTLEQAPLSIERVVTIGAQILSALGEAHACAVVHCDLTSNNVIIEKLRDGGDFAKVIDFGLARLFDDHGGGATLGTPEYMAPEQIRGQTLTPATDLYSTGVLLYELIVGRTPFAAATVPVVIKGHLEATPTRLEEIVPGCPPDLGELIQWALEKEPGRRPPDAETMRRALLSVFHRKPSGMRCECGEPTTWDQRFCATCGAALTRVAAPVAPPPPLELAVGSHRLNTGDVAAARQVRSTRLTCELDRVGSSLIGRDQELAELLGHCRGRGQRNSMALLGEAGIGKARLLLEARRRLTRELPIFTAAPDPSGQRTSWYPILSILEEVLGHHGAMTIESLTQAVTRAGLPSRDVPGLAEIFSLPGPANSLELAVRRREAHAAALRALLSVSRRFPRAVLCFADIDEYDVPSRRVISTLSEIIAESGMRMVVTATRDADVPNGIPGLELAGLDVDHSFALAQAIVGDDNRLPTAEVLYSITAGSPAAIEQLAGWVLTGNSPATAPALLVDLVSMRISRMPQMARRILQAVAIYGSVVERRLVEATLAEGPLPALDDPACVGMLVVDGDVVTIPSEIVADVILACTPADVRRALHQRALDLIGEQAAPGLVGHHAEHSGDMLRAYDCYLAAGHHAVNRFDDGGASIWYERALAVARHLHSHPDAGARVARASYELADVLRCTGHARLGDKVLGEAIRRYPDETNSPEVARIQGRIAVACNDPSTSIEHFQRAIGMAMRAGTRDFLCETYIDLARALDRLGYREQAIAELSQAVDVLTVGQGLATGAGPDNLWYLGLNLAERCLAAGLASRAREIAGGALEQAKRVNSMRGRGRLSTLLARICDQLGQSAAAMRFRANAIDLMRQLGDRRSTAELLLDNAAASKGRASTAPPTAHPDWRTDPTRGVRLASKLASEVGWQEGIRRSRNK